MPRNRKIFYVVFTIFVIIVIFVAIDMGTRTNAPWNKRKDSLKKYDIDHFKKKL
ncbi:MAG TPA: hypothetical protein VNW06_11895 [Cytophagaceae bacterium]|jgi:hypothetical protein|nr:hypothetical protein [Cytophagaceae bacterium]